MSTVLILFVLFPSIASASCDCNTDLEGRDRPAALKLKLLGIASILVAGGLGVLMPVLGRWVSAICPEKDVFFVVKSFAAGVILATALVHILPEAFDRFGSPCLDDYPWHKFPFAGFLSMLSALGTLMVSTVATSYHRSRHLNKASQVDDGDEEKAREHGQHGQHVHPHTHAAHGHSHGAVPGPEDDTMPHSTRHRIVSQVLELGIVVHSVLIGISLGASASPSTIRPLVGALGFHQFFEGMGLGSCIAQAKFKAKVMATMALFFTLTTPLGIALGIAVSSSYNADGTTALIVEGVLEASSAGILIYLSLVDLLAAEFADARVQTRGRLQLWMYVAVLLGAGLMSFIAMWS